MYGSDLILKVGSGSDLILKTGSGSDLRLKTGSGSDLILKTGSVTLENTVIGLLKMEKEIYLHVQVSRHKKCNINPHPTGVISN